MVIFVFSSRFISPVSAVVWRDAWEFKRNAGMIMSIFAFQAFRSSTNISAVFFPFLERVDMAWIQDRKR